MEKVTIVTMKKISIHVAGWDHVEERAKYRINSRYPIGKSPRRTCSKKRSDAAAFVTPCSIGDPKLPPPLLLSLKRGVNCTRGAKYEALGKSERQGIDNFATRERRGDT